MNRHASRIEPGEHTPNPYAPPRSSSEEPAPAGGVWRKGKLLVAPRDGTLPPRCIKCNAPASPKYKRQRLYWHKWGWYLLVLLNLFIYALVALFVRERTSVRLGLCKRHWQWRRGTQAGIVLMLLASLVLALTAESGSEGSAGVLALCGGLASVLVAIFGLRLLRPKRIDAQTMQLHGCGTDFLASLPEYPGAD
ncbi:hypothetical protein [Niveibacterium sp. SC-1]|uniref:hypothetical protein n=1 Tax=Niveibacterium sp. SC-1 TaxID=3135646 RepID=UPI00311F88F7